MISADNESLTPYFIPQISLSLWNIRLFFSRGFPITELKKTFVVREAQKPKMHNGPRKENKGSVLVLVLMAS